MLKHNQRLAAAVVFYAYALFRRVIGNKKFILAELAETQHSSAGAVMSAYFAIALYDYTAIWSIVLNHNPCSRLHG